MSRFPYPTNLYCQIFGRFKLMAIRSNKITVVSPSYGNINKYCLMQENQKIGFYNGSL